ncbi:50S ribosomal protein L22 [Bacteroidales bacterium OttesenSCG-928-I21]|nr:50S ribosomal protein L22 [Bacteroidales bacterium OttesenSCG-928-I21]
MGARKRIKANKTKEDKSRKSFAILRNCPTSPRKMRLVADLVRGVEVDKALDILKYSPKSAAKDVEKLLMSAVANWQAKNETLRIEDADLFVKEIYVDSGSVLKRIKPAPQGRGYRIRKRSNHVTIVVGSRNEELLVNENA